MKSDEKIDFVVLWVDPSDKEWQKSREKYIKQVNGNKYIDNSVARYRDWGLFKYWFRGVEQFAPWVNKVHLVTCGHVPDWLNVNHPKLHIVKHEDFMPKDALPTFNSNAIELCTHKIPGLAEQFVLFNDDMYIIRPLKPTDFFRGNLPVNTMSLFAIAPLSTGKSFYKAIGNNLSIINDHFDFRYSKRRNLTKYLSLAQREWLLFTYPMLLYRSFMGFRNFHIPISYLKSTFDKVWKLEPDILQETVYSHMRDNEKNVSHWLFNYWQFAAGTFHQRDSHFGKSMTMGDKRINKTISQQKCKIICINDTEHIEDFDCIKNDLELNFKKILPKKCEFEK